MVHYKLTYFDARGFAEISRFLLKQAGVDFEDCRIKKEDWPDLKDKMPFGQLPVLEVDGVKICQSFVIARYLANEFNLAGKSKMDKVRADMIVDCVRDCVIGATMVMYTKQENQSEAVAKLNEETLPKHVKNLNKLLEENDGGNGFFVGDEATWADFVWSQFVTMSTAAPFKILLQLDEYPKLKALHDKVCQLPKIKEWLESRPQTVT